MQIMNFMTSDPSAFWTMVGSIVAALALVGGAAVAITRIIRKNFQKAVEAAAAPLRQENARLREEVEARLRYPGFAKDIIQLTETAADLKIKELEEQHRRALSEKEQEVAERLQGELDGLNALRAELVQATMARTALEQRLQSAVITAAPRTSTNAICLPTGLILLVRYRGRLGAVQAVDQGGDNRGKMIRYAWWYAPEGTVDFLSNETQFGFDETGEGRGVNPELHVGPIRLEWSNGGNGTGWVYFGPDTNGSPDYELAVTRHIDITKVNALQHTFVKHERFRA